MPVSNSASFKAVPVECSHSIVSFPCVQIRYPVLLTPTEKEMARVVCLAFGQAVSVTGRLDEKALSLKDAIARFDRLLLLCHSLLCHRQALVRFSMVLSTA